ncbi:glycosyltransferase family 4 protein [candidate division WOR-3 bacterium]|nr:glycosyltransferase family 4 protein [candidate division WOR-3 bacterium]
MKSIVFISALDIWSLGEGKGAQSLWLTLKAYADRDFKIYFITGNKGSIQKIYKNIEVIRFSLHWVKKFFPLRKIGFFARIMFWFLFQIIAFKLILTVCKKHKISLVYAYEIYSVPVAKLISKFLKIPIISRFQGTTLKPYVNTFLWKLRFFEHIIAYKIPTDLLIMTDDGTQGNQVLNALNIDIEKIKFWMNGVDKTMYIPNFDKYSLKQKLGVNKKTKVLLSVCRLVKWKRVDRIIQAIPHIISQNKEIVLIIVGDGEEKSNLLNLARRLKVIPYVHFTGAILHQEIKEYMNLANIFISLYELSNIGNPLLEAMVCGRCIITLNKGDTFKIIKNKENGILLESKELKTLPQIIVNLLDDKKLQLKLGGNAKKYATQHFWDWQERMNTEVELVTRKYFLHNPPQAELS